jgi:phosphatidylethanolamine-binding protein (PEBP) family uncharacterized protein
LFSWRIQRIGLAFATFAALALPVSTAQAAVLKVTSSAFPEGGLIAAKYAGHLVTKRGASALQPGLTRDQFLDAVKGHVLDIGSLVARAPSRQRSP